MSDEHLRELERAYKATGAQGDGEAWVRALVTASPPDPLRMVSMLIQFGRALEALTTEFRQPHDRHVRRAESIENAIAQPVTPDDMARWLGGSHELGLAEGPRATSSRSATPTPTAPSMTSLVCEGGCGHSIQVQAKTETTWTCPACSSR